MAYRTGDPDLDRRIDELLDTVGEPVGRNRDQLAEILTTAVLLAGDGTDRLDLKITNAALKEMRRAFQIFAPYRDVPKVTIFGSARTLPDDPLYAQARDVAAVLASKGWMVVTGAGPGIMAAGLEGAGRDKSFGVNIRLPFEQTSNPFITGDPKLVEMRYFFTRKLMLLKESDGFIALPGGFGTLDETFELLTLVQTGKAQPAPIVLLDVPSDSGYWTAWHRFLTDHVATRGLVSPDDCVLYRITDDPVEASDEILEFYRNYHSIRYVGATLVVRLRAAPRADELAELSEAFADICVEGGIEAIQPLPAEVRSNDHLELPRIAFAFDRIHLGRFRALIDALNQLSSAPEDPPTPPG